LEKVGLSTQQGFISAFWWAYGAPRGGLSAPMIVQRRHCLAVAAAR
jgi:hypothetical protein